MPSVKEISKKGKKRGARVIPVIVAGAGFRSLAFRDKKGELRPFWTETLLPLPVHILDIEN
jgi:hypothetical protein